MTQFGYTAMCEQAPARQLVTDLVAAELAGFDFSVTSDHFFPWIEDQGHAPNAWVVLGAAAITGNIEDLGFPQAACAGSGGTP